MNLLHKDQSGARSVIPTARVLTSRGRSVAGSDLKPNIPRGERFWPLTTSESAAIEALFEEQAIRELISSLRSRPDYAGIEVQDAAYWIKGCGLLGKLRFAVLLSVKTRKHPE